jgi:hypothetical protein
MTNEHWRGLPPENFRKVSQMVTNEQGALWKRFHRTVRSFVGFVL